MNCSLPGSPIHGIFQARALGWVTISYSRWSSQPKERTFVSCVSHTDRHLGSLNVEISLYFPFCLKPLLSFGIKDILTSQQDLENVPFLFSGKICICLISSLTYFIIEHLVEFSGKELDFCPITREGAESKLKLPINVFLTLANALKQYWCSVTLLTSLGSGYLSEFVWHFPAILFILN